MQTETNNTVTKSAVIHWTLAVWGRGGLMGDEIEHLVEDWTKMSLTCIGACH